MYRRAYPEEHTANAPNSKNGFLEVAYGLKLCLEAEKNWRKLRGYKLIPSVIEGVFCKDGVFKEEAA